VATASRALVRVPTEETTHHDQSAASRVDGARRSGFTLVELLITVVVLGSLGGIAVLGLANFRGDASLVACRADVATVSKAVDAYAAREGGYVGVSVDDVRAPGYLRDTPSSTVYVDTITGAVSSTACP
jgi:general secretion pathway protein G